jgi:Tfp pilus assembly protein FimT
MIELLIVVAILAIAAAIAVPMVSSAGSMQLRAAVNIVAADLEYAKSMSISRGQKYSVVFDTMNGQYRIVVINQSGNETPVTHPITQSLNYVVRFQSDSRLSQVNIANVSFDGTNTVSFDYLGSPWSGTGSSATQLNSGVITLQAGGITRTVNVEPVTGYISIPPLN